MKKSLTMLLAIAMVISMFATAAFAADASLTTQQKFDALKEAGIFNGYPDGTAGLDKEMTRAEFAKVLALVNKLDVNTTANTYTDVPAAHWAAGYIGAVTKAGLVNGVGAGKFDPNGKVTIEQLAKTLVLSLGLEQSSDAVTGTTSAWATGYVAAAIKAGLLDSMASYKTNATRALLVEASYQVVQTTFLKVTGTKVIDDKNIEVTFSDNATEKVALTTALVANKATDVKVTHNGIDYTVSVTFEGLAATAKQTDGKTITVSFNRALTASEKTDLTFDLASDSIPYTVTKTFSDDNKSVALKATYLPAGTYTVTVKGMDAITVSVTAEVLDKIEIGATTLSVADGQNLGIKAYNQFGGVVDYPTLNVNAYDGSDSAVGTIGIQGDYSTGFSLDIANPNNVANKVQKGDVIVVSVLSPDTGKSATKSFTVTDASTITSLKLGTVVPLEGNTRISAGDTDLVIPYTFVDSAGNKFTLSGNTVVNGNGNTAQIGDFQFIVSDMTVIDPNTIVVDNDGVLTFDAAKSGTAVITVLNVKAGSSANTTVTIGDAQSIGKFQLNNPGVRIVTGEKVKFPYVATDNYGALIAATNFSKSNYNGQLKFTLNGNPFTGASWNANGELSLDFTGVAQGSYILYAWTGNTFTTLSIKVEDASYPVRVQGLNDLAALYAVGGTDTVDFDSVKFTDNYGRTIDSLPAGYTLSVVSSDPSVISYSGGVLKGLKVGTSTIKIDLVDNKNVNDPNYNDVTAYSFTATVISDDKITSFAIDTIGDVYAPDAKIAAYVKTITLIGKNSSGKSVAIDQSNYFTSITSDKTNVLAIDAKDTFHGVAAGTATLSAYNGASKLADATVTVSEAAPYVKTVAFDNTEVTMGNSTTNTSIAGDVTITDQYGVDLVKDGVANAGLGTNPPATGSYGVWSSSNKSIASIDSSTGVITSGTTDGSVTISFVSYSGVISTVSLEVK